MCCWSSVGLLLQLEVAAVREAAVSCWLDRSRFLASRGSSGATQKLAWCTRAGEWIFWVDCGAFGLDRWSVALWMLADVSLDWWRSVSVERWLDWGGMGSRVQWLFLVFLGRNGV